MGGSINVAIRFSNGEAFCNERWTNSMPFWFGHPDIFSDEARAREYMKANRNTDYVLDKYASGRPSQLRNSEYGLVVFDYVTKTVLDNNSYTSFNNIIPIMAVSNGKLKEGFEAFARAGRLTAGHSEGGGKLVSRTGPLTLQEATIFAKVGSADYRSMSRDIFVIDPSPFRIEELPREPFSIMKERLIQLGFPMNKSQGLNATHPKLPPCRTLEPEEQIARELYRDLKSNQLEGWDKWDGIPWEKLTDEGRNRLLATAREWTENPEKISQWRQKMMFG